MESVKGYKRLSPKMKVLFMEVYTKHVLAVSNSNKHKFSIEKLKRIKINQIERCFEAHYEHDWYKYYPDGTWG